MRRLLCSKAGASVLLLLLLICSGCNQKKERAQEFNKILFSPEYASGFEILGVEGSESVLIRSKNPWQGTREDVRELLILRNGEEAPSGYRGEILKGYARRIVCMSSGHMAMLSLLGKDDAIVGGSGLKYISSPRIASRKSGIAEVGYEGAYDYEALVAANPDLVILYGVNSASLMEPKLKELGIPFIYVGDYLEESPLGKAEWIMAIGECVGKRDEAAKQFSPIKNRYNALVKLAATAKTDELPKVMLNSPYNEIWFLPPAGSYMVRLIQDAGGEYLYMQNNGNSSEPISMEEARRLMEDADVWLNVGEDFNSMLQIRKKLPIMAGIDVFCNGQIYSNTRRTTPGGGNDFYESGIVQPDLILRDLIMILHPGLLDAGFTYYKKIPNIHSEERKIERTER